jgi:hypothetical protein
MAKNTKLATDIIDGQADLLAAALKDGFIDIYDGSQPESPETDVGNRKMCVSLKLGSPAFMPAVKGVISANPIQPGRIIADVNPATWARLYRADHKTPVMDVSVGTKDANIIVPTTHMVSGVTMGVSSFLHSVAKSTSGA